MQNDKAIFDDQKHDGLYQHNVQLLSLGLKAKKMHLFQDVSTFIFQISDYLFFRWPQITCSLFPPSGRPQRSKGENYRVIERVILTNVYNREAF